MGTHIRSPIFNIFVCPWLLSLVLQRCNIHVAISIRNLSGNLTHKKKDRQLP